jgi:hypothetical protein
MRGEFNEDIDPDADLRQRYIEEGWGAIAVELGMDPINCESQTRSVLWAWSEERKRRSEHMDSYVATNFEMRGGVIVRKGA